MKQQEVCSLRSSQRQDCYYTWPSLWESSLLINRTFTLFSGWKRVLKYDRTQIKESCIGIYTAKPTDVLQYETRSKERHRKLQRQCDGHVPPTEMILVTHRFRPNDDRLDLFLTIIIQYNSFLILTCWLNSYYTLQTITESAQDNNKCTKICPCIIKYLEYNNINSNNNNNNNNRTNYCSKLY
jgi:hypothetical protein